jgi:hypothetical protein
LYEKYGDTVDIQECETIDFKIMQTESTMFFGQQDETLPHGKGTMLTHPEDDEIQFAILQQGEWLDGQ